jgi:hypothetical protein
MSDEKGKKAGGISKFKQQYTQIGGGKPSERLDSQESKSQDSEPSGSPTLQPSEHQDRQLSKSSALEVSQLPDSQPSNHQTIEPSERLDTGESSMPNLPTVERPSVQKSRSKQQRDKLTVYLEPELNDWIRQQVIIEKRRRGHHVELSDIINEALQKMKDNQ